MSKDVGRKTPCPFPTTHRRVNQALSIFKDINLHYQDPEKFTSDLNNLIQTLRNITFMLQSEKDTIKDFSGWYAPIQEVMRKDDKMRWLVDSRNHIVKRGDLEKESYISVRIVDHFNKEIFTQKFDPFFSTNNVIQSFRKTVDLKYPKMLESDILIEAERKWIVHTYPKIELVDVLIYCFSVLVDVVESAHRVLGCSILSCEENNFFNADDDFKLILRNNLKKERVSRIRYVDGNPVTSSLLRLTKEDMFGGKIEEGNKEELSKRYGDFSELVKFSEPTNEGLPFCYMDFHLEMSKRFMATDGGLAPICFLYFSKDKKNNPPRIIAFNPSDSTSRYDMAEKIAEAVEVTHCKALIFIGEVWVGDYPEDEKDYVPARLQVDRKEAISILAATPNKTIDYYIPFHRGENGEIVFEELTILEKGEWPFLFKVQKVWEDQIKE